MKIIINEKQEKFLKKLILKELRDTSMYAAKADAIKKCLDDMYSYINVKVDGGSFPEKRWTIFTLDNGKPFKSVNQDIMFYQMQRKWKDLCGDTDERDEMLKKIQDEWLADKKKNN